MYEQRLLKDIGTHASQAAAAAIWGQWVALGSLASPAVGAVAKSMIDPEALLLASLFFREQERRLGDLVSWWARVGANLTSVHRLRTISTHFPAPSGQDAFEQFSHLAADAGDRRWEGHAKPSLSWTPRSDKGPKNLSLVHPSTVWLRLRAGFGVGAKSDAFAFLLGMEGTRASVRVIATATGYSEVSIRKAVSEMALAGLLRETEGRPTEYFAPGREWARVLDFYTPVSGPHSDPEIPPWRDWAKVYAYLAHVAHWSRPEASQVAQGPRVHASKARDILERFRTLFSFHEIRVPEPERYPGVGAIDCLAETTEILSDWIAGLP